MFPNCQVLKNSPLLKEKSVLYSIKEITYVFNTSFIGYIIHSEHCDEILEIIKNNYYLFRDAYITARVESDGKSFASAVGLAIKLGKVDVIPHLISLGATFDCVYASPDPSVSYSATEYAELCGGSDLASRVKDVIPSFGHYSIVDDDATLSPVGFAIYQGKFDQIPSLINDESLRAVCTLSDDKKLSAFNYAIRIRKFGAIPVLIDAGVEYPFVDARLPLVLECVCFQDVVADFIGAVTKERALIIFQEVFLGGKAIEDVASAAEIAIYNSSAIKNINPFNNYSNYHPIYNALKILVAESVSNAQSPRERDEYVKVILVYLFSRKIKELSMEVTATGAGSAEIESYFPKEGEEVVEISRLSDADKLEERLITLLQSKIKINEGQELSALSYILTIETNDFKNLLGKFIKSARKNNISDNDLFIKFYTISNSVLSMIGHLITRKKFDQISKLIEVAKANGVSDENLYAAAYTTSNHEIFSMVGYLIFTKNFDQIPKLIEVAKAKGASNEVLFGAARISPWGRASVIGDLIINKQFDQIPNLIEVAKANDVSDEDLFGTVAVLASGKKISLIGLLIMNRQFDQIPKLIEVAKASGVSDGDLFNVAIAIPNGKKISPLEYIGMLKFSDEAEVKAAKEIELFLLAHTPVAASSSEAALTEMRGPKSLKKEKESDVDSDGEEADSDGCDGKDKEGRKDVEEAASAGSSVAAAGFSSLTGSTKEGRHPN